MSKGVLYKFALPYNKEKRYKAMKKTTRLIAVLLSAALSAGGNVPVMAADNEKNGKKRICRFGICEVGRQKQSHY